MRKKFFEKIPLNSDQCSDRAPLETVNNFFFAWFLLTPLTCNIFCVQREREREMKK